MPALPQPCRPPHTNAAPTRPRLSRAHSFDRFCYLVSGEIKDSDGRVLRVTRRDSRRWVVRPLGEGEAAEGARGATYLQPMMFIHLVA